MEKHLDLSCLGWRRVDGGVLGHFLVLPMNPFYQLGEQGGWPWSHGACLWAWTCEESQRGKEH